MSKITTCQVVVVALYECYDGGLRWVDGWGGGLCTDTLLPHNLPSVCLHTREPNGALFISAL